MAALGLRCDDRLLIVAASLVERGLQARAQLLRGPWDLPRPGTEPASPALAGGFLTSGPPGKSSLFLSFPVCPSAMTFDSAEKSLSF